MIDLVAIEVTLKTGKCEIVHPMFFESYRRLHSKEIKKWAKIQVDNYFFKFNIKERGEYKK